VPFTLHNARALGGRLAVLEYQAQMRTSLKQAVDRVGGRAAVGECGPPATEDYSVPMLAWYLHVHTAAVGLDPPPRGVVFRAAPGPNGRLDPRMGSGWRDDFRFRVGPFRVYARCAA
jgi:hypothetical protein